MNVKEIIRANYSSQAEFARRVGMNPGTLSLVLNGRYTGDKLDEYRGMIAAAIEEDHGVFVASKGGQEWSGVPAADGDMHADLTRMASALTLLMDRLDDRSRSYLGYLIDELAKLAGDEG
jgi:transcriptional regulator with XRE-family HTH domain